MSNLSKNTNINSEVISQKNLLEAKKKCGIALAYLKEFSNTKNNKNINKAIDLYLESIQLHSEFSEPYMSLAYISLKLDKPKEAIEFLKKVITLEPFNLYARKMFKQASQNTDDDKTNVDSKESTKDNPTTKPNSFMMKLQQHTQNIYDDD